MQEKAVAVEHRRAGRTLTHDRGIAAQILFPYEIALEVIAIQSMHAEIGIDALAVGDRRLGGVGIGLLDGDSRLAFERDLLPEDFARGAVEAVDLPAIDNVRRPTAAESARAAATKASRAALARSAAAKASRTTRHHLPHVS